MGRRWATTGPCRVSQRLAALRSQSCFSAPSCGAMNSGGRASTCVWPGATTLAPRKAWKLSTPPSARRRVEHCGEVILRDQGSPAQTLEACQRPNRLDGPHEQTLERCGRNPVQHQTDVVVGGDGRDAEQAL